MIGENSSMIRKSASIAVKFSVPLVVVLFVGLLLALPVANYYLTQMIAKDVIKNLEKTQLIVFSGLNSVMKNCTGENVKKVFKTSSRATAHWTLKSSPRHRYLAATRWRMSQSVRYASPD